MATFNFRIRTITAGMDISDITDLSQIKKTITFLKKAKSKLEKEGYEVQTIRIALPHLHLITDSDNPLSDSIIEQLKAMDALCTPDQVMLAIGDPFKPNSFESWSIPRVLQLIRETSLISFHTAIASVENGIHEVSIRLASEICHALAMHSDGGEANFRYTASANCTSGIPYFPTSYHEGPSSFGIGLEIGNLFQDAILNRKNQSIKNALESALVIACKPIIQLSEELSQAHDLIFNGIDASTAPGLDSSIGKALEMISGVAFGDTSTLTACAAVTDVLKSLPFKTCGYSGLMLPVIEDKILAQRASEGRYSIKELLLFSAVSGIGLDVVPIPGETAPKVIAGLYRDMAALSLKYNAKMLSARLFPIPGKATGEWARFENPYLTDCKVMALK